MTVAKNSLFLQEESGDWPVGQYKMLLSGLGWSI
jgi:hypothetical protein